MSPKKTATTLWSAIKSEWQLSILVTLVASTLIGVISIKQDIAVLQERYSNVSSGFALVRDSVDARRFRFYAIENNVSYLMEKDREKSIQDHTYVRPW